MDIDAGLTIATVDLGDYVWFDSNRNGLQDPIESGIGNYLVELFDANDNSMKGSTFTNGLGYYLFEDVLPGTYYIKFNPVSLPNGYIYTLQDEGNNDQIDSDADVNGQTDPFMISLNQNDDLSFNSR